jgi:N-acetylglutamate synthase/N-acetylornithine aminotransferase
MKRYVVDVDHSTDQVCVVYANTQEEADTLYENDQYTLENMTEEDEEFL